MDKQLIQVHFDILKKIGGKAFVAVLNGKIVGEVEIVFAEEPYPYGKYCFLEVLVVHKNFRHRGIGTKLVAYCLNYAKKAGFRKMDTIPEDDRSYRLYQKLGFRKIFNLYKLKTTCKRKETKIAAIENPLNHFPKEMLYFSDKRIGFMILNKHVPKPTLCISYLWIKPRHLRNRELLREIANCAVLKTFKDIRSRI